jgi:hypothetical protein
MNRSERLERNKKLKQILKPDGRLLDACLSLRYQVEHPNEDADITASVSGVRVKDPETIQTVKVDGVVIGYMVKPSSPLEINPYMDRYAYVKIPGYTINDLSKQEAAAIMAAFFEAFFDHQQGEIKEIEGLTSDAMGFWQRFMVVFPVKFQHATSFVPGSFNG